MKKIYTFKYCKKIANLYSHRRDLKSDYYGVYDAICRNKWGKKLFSHMNRPPKKRIYTYEVCKERITKYEYLKIFREKESGAYAAIIENKWHNLLTPLKRSNSISLRTIYAYEFKELKAAYVGLTYNINVRNHDHHRKGSVYNFAKLNNINYYSPIILKENIKSEEAPYYEDFYFEQYKHNGWNMINRAKTGGLGGTIIKKENIVAFDYDGNLVSNGHINIVSEQINVPINLIRLCLRHVNNTCLNYRVFSIEEWRNIGSPPSIEPINKLHEEIVVLDKNMEEISILKDKRSAMRYFGLSSTNNSVSSLHHGQIKHVFRKYKICFLEDYEKYKKGEYKKVESVVYYRFLHEYFIPKGIPKDEEQLLIQKLEHPTQWEAKRLKKNKQKNLKVKDIKDDEKYINVAGK